MQDGAHTVIAPRDYSVRRLQRKTPRKLLHHTACWNSVAFPQAARERIPVVADLAGRLCAISLPAPLSNHERALRQPLLTACGECDSDEKNRPSGAKALMILRALRHG